MEWQNEGSGPEFLFPALISDTGRDGRVDECDGLENRYTRKGIVGSNPTPSANTLFPISINYMPISPVTTTI